MGLRGVGLLSDTCRDFGEQPSAQVMGHQSLCCRQHALVGGDQTVGKLVGCVRRRLSRITDEAKERFDRSIGNHGDCIVGVACDIQQFCQRQTRIQYRQSRLDGLDICRGVTGDAGVIDVMGQQESSPLDGFEKHARRASFGSDIIEVERCVLVVSDRTQQCGIGAVGCGRRTLSDARVMGSVRAATSWGGSGRR